MKGLVLVLLVGQVACGLGMTVRESPLCVPGGPVHVPHPTDCSKYYTCEGGEAILQECPPGLWWNVAVESCDFPENVVCQVDESTTGASSDASTAAPTIAPPQCVPGGPTHIAHPTDCTKYYTCEGDHATLQECPPGLWWSTSTEGCDFPENAVCEAAGGSTAAPGGSTTPAPPKCVPGGPIHIAHPTDCTKYYTCDNGQAVLQDCAPGLWWNVDIEGCDLPEHTNCAAASSGPTAPTTPPTTPPTAPPTTPPPPVCGPGSPTHIPHPTDCTKYYTCEGGQAILQECPPGLWWNTVIEGCDFPENVDCAAAP